MTRTEIQRFESLLQDLREELSHSLTRREEIHIVRAADVMDDLQHSTSRDFAVAEIQRKNLRILEIDAAMRRIAGGVYAVCEDCEDPIPLKRLNAVPWTAVCVRCQELRDSGNEEHGPNQQFQDSNSFLGTAA